MAYLLFCVVMVLCVPKKKYIGPQAIYVTSQKLINLVCESKYQKSYNESICLTFSLGADITMDFAQRNS